MSELCYTSAGLYLEIFRAVSFNSSLQLNPVPTSKKFEYPQNKLIQVTSFSSHIYISTLVLQDCYLKVNMLLNNYRDLILGGAKLKG